MQNLPIEFAEWIRLRFQNTPLEFDNYWIDYDRFPNEPGKAYTTNELFKMFEEEIKLKINEQNI